MPSWLARVRSLLERHPVGLPVLLAAALTSPALLTGLHGDTLMMRAMARTTGWSALYAKPAQTPERVAKMLEHGALPWWSSAEAFAPAHVRPLASLVNWVDFRVLPDVPWLMHLHSVLWYSALVWIVAIFFRRVLADARWTSLATLLFAVDDSHGVVVGHVVLRPVLVAGLLALLALLAHDRWLRNRWWPGPVVAALCLGLGLFTLELAVAALLVLPVQAMLARERSRGARWLGLLPSLAVTFAWLFFFEADMAGAYGSGAYVDPLREPGVFLWRTLETLPVYLVSLFAVPPADLWPFLPASFRFVLWSAFAVVLVGLLVAARRGLRDRRCLLLGALLIAGLVPAFAAMANDRYTVLASVASSGLVARVVLWAWDGRRWLAIALIGVHLVLAPPLLALRTAEVAYTFGRTQRACIDGVPEDATGKSLVVVNVPDMLTALGLFLAHPERGIAPARYRVLGATTRAVRVRRLDARSLELSVDAGYLEDPFSRVNRGPQLPVAVGEVVSLSDVEIEVLDAVDGRPKRVRFTFATPLEDARYRWLTWKGAGLVVWRPPPPGGSVSLPPIDYLSLMLGPR